MITIGVDAHKRVHVAYAVDEAGREVGQWDGANNASAWKHLLAWASAQPGERQWGIEGAWSYGRNLAQFLVASGETVFDVNPRWTAFGRQEAPRLPKACADDDTVVLDLLTNERDQALFDATRIRNQIHCPLMQIDPNIQFACRLSSQRPG